MADMKKYNFDAVIFDLDGVITNTAVVHAAAWESMFNDFLIGWGEKKGKSFQKFSSTNDYLTFVDGKPRYQGVESFLRSRGIDLPYGSPSDSPDLETICGLGNRKNHVFNQIVEREGVDVYESTVKLIDELRKEGIKLGVASSSRNCKHILERSNLLQYFDVRVDGEVSIELGLNGKPEPDIFLVSCDKLGVKYHRAVVIEDAVSGVQAGQKGNFGLVLGIARHNNEQELRMNGADMVVSDLSEIDGIEDIEHWFEEGIVKDSWSITFTGYDKHQEKVRESLLAQGNGFFAVRGSLEEAELNDYNYPGTYVNNFYRMPKISEGEKLARPVPSNVMNCLEITFKVAEGDWFNPNRDEVIELERSLNLLSGVLHKRMIARDQDGRETLIESRRIVSIANKHHAAVDYTLTPLNYNGYVRIKSSLSVSSPTEKVIPNDKSCQPVEQGGKENISYVLARSSNCNDSVAVASMLEVFYEDWPLATNFQIKQGEGWVNTYIKAAVKEGQSLRIEKLISIASSFDTETPDPLAFVKKDVADLKSFGVLHASSIGIWDSIWQDADISIEGDRFTQKRIRLYSYHNLIANTHFSKNNFSRILNGGLHCEGDCAGMPWQKQIVFNFLCLHRPSAADDIIKFCIVKLDDARETAKKLGYKGALFTNENEENHINQLHTTIFIAYSVLQFIDNNCKSGKIDEQMVELLLEICSFFESKIIYLSEKERYDIESALSHNKFNANNGTQERDAIRKMAFINIMVVWIFNSCNELIKELDAASMQSLFNKLSINEMNFDKWKRVSQRMSLSITTDGIVEPFEGFISLNKKQENSPEIDALLPFYFIGEKNGVAIIKGLGYEVHDDLFVKNFDFYFEQIKHELNSKTIIYSVLASDIGKKELGLNLFKKILGEISNYPPASSNGVDLAQMAGVVLGFSKE